MTDLKTGILLWSQTASWREMTDAATRVDRIERFVGGAKPLIDRG